MKPNSNFPPAFQQVFFTAVSLTVLSGAMSFNLAAKDNLTPQQTRIFETCTTTWNMGIGAIFGLLGSKATDLLGRSNEEDSDDNSES
jgi:hypothetical protein